MFFRNLAVRSYSSSSFLYRLCIPLISQFGVYSNKTNIVPIIYGFLKCMRILAFPSSFFNAIVQNVHQNRWMETQLLI